MPILQRTPFMFRPLARVATRRVPHVRHSSSRSEPVTIGIRCEDPGRIWERRAPLTPDVVAELVSRDGVRVLVQDSDRRVFPTDEYIRAGAEARPTLEPAHIVLGIKEPPLHTLVTGAVPSPNPSRPNTLVPRTHMMFSHTIKGQEYNMPLLSRFLKGGNAYAGLRDEPGLEPRLIDYELLTDREGKRTVAFGWFAGVAGALEALSAMAHTHLQQGVATPFLYTPRPHASPSIDSLRSSLRYIGDQIVEHGTPKRLGPCVIGVTGSGNVTQGILSILSELPIVNTRPEDLPSLINNPDADLRKVYLVQALPNTYLSRTDGKHYDRADYYANPGSYQSDFHTKIAPYLTLLLNGAGWAPAFPRLLTTAQLPLATRLAAVGDVSCDLNGGLEFVTRATTLDAPSYDVNDVAVVAVDILPASLPRDASAAFAGSALKYVREIVKEYRGEEKSEEGREVREALERATVTQGGKVRKGFEWLEDKVRIWRGNQDRDGSTITQAVQSVGLKKKKRVLVLGSGMVAGPAVDELAGWGDVEVIVGSNVLAEAEQLVAEHPNAKALKVDITDLDRVSSLVREADVVISLLPAPFHPSVAELCIEHKTHLVTASYISPAMQTLHSRALSADVLLLNEIGLDPGIDHCSAHSLLSRLRADNKKVRVSRSGINLAGVPAGVLRAAGEGAQFRLGGKNWQIPGERLLLEHFPDVPVSNILKFEGIANRNSLPYAETYALGDVTGLRTMLRGTLRYPGFAALMHSFKAIGLLEATKTVKLDHWASLVRLALEEKLQTSIPADTASLMSAFSDVLPPARISALVDALQNLALLPSLSPASSPSLPPVPSAPAPPADLLAVHLAHVLRYQPGERDLVLLAHEVVARSGQTEEVHTSTLVVYGDKRASAMARTVGLPVALAALRVLDGAVLSRGVRGPTYDESVWKAVLEGLEERGLGVKEGVKNAGEAGMEGGLLDGLERTIRESA